MRVAKNLNYERKSRYVLTVRAEDCANDVGNGETRFDSAELIITITDINDNPPTFLDSPYLAYVMENVIPNGGYVITVKAYDADTPPFNSQVRYFLKEGDADLFRINASTGEISLLRALDREQQAEYTLTLVAMDTGELQSFIIILYKNLYGFKKNTYFHSNCNGLDCNYSLFKSLLNLNFFRSIFF